MKEFYKQYRKSGAIFLLAIVVQSIAFAQEKQEITLKGKLKDEISGETLIGATLLVKGTKTAVQSDVDGNFELKTPKEPPFTLVISYVGYQTKEIEIYEEDQEIDIKLRSNRALSEVVVVGYGEQKRTDITGSVASVPTELKTQPVSSVERLLQGAVSGVIVTQTSGQPGGGVSVQVRGNNSINAGSDPLYVIDGFPVYNDYSVNDAGVTDGPKINPLSSINTADIESIDVLKDASATAIYGSRGANGVVIITTKKGSKDQSSITYDAYVGAQYVINTLPLLNAGQWWQLRKDAAFNSGKSITAANNTILTGANNGGYSLDTSGTGTDWQAAAFSGGIKQSHTLSILTGSDKTKVAFSGNYYNENGTLQNTNFIRYSARLNIEHDYNSRLKFNTYLNASSINSNVAPAAIVTNLLLTPPSLPIYKNDGTFVVSSPFESTLANPINSLYNQVNQTSTQRFLGNFSAEYKIIEGLTAKVLVGADVTSNKQNRYLPNSTYEGLSAGGGDATVGSISSANWLNENTLNYNKTFSRKHKLNATVGFSAQKQNTESATTEVTGFASDAYTYNNLSSGTTLKASNSNAYSWALASYFGRVNYGYDDKYLLTLTVRSDGSSRFGTNNKWGYFPSAAVGWNLHKENFLKQVKQISQLKARFSAGLTGNQSIPPYSSLAQLAYYRYNFSNANVSGYSPNTAYNPNLGWEQTAQYDFGIDIGLLNNRISFVSDIYYKKTTDLLLSAIVSGTSGLGEISATTQSSTIFQNLGAVSNEGFEFSANTQNLIGKFKWNTLLVYAVNRNEILNLGDGVNRIVPSNTTTTPSVLQVGSPVGSFLVYQTDGLISAGDAGVNALTPAADKTAGGQRYKDQNGDGKIDANDLVVVNNQPGSTIGLTNNFSYKGFDLTVFFQSQLGAKLYNANRASLELGTGYTNASSVYANAYRDAGTQSASDPGNTGTDVKEAYQNPAITQSDRFVEDASYLRLKNITLGYTFQAALISKLKLKSLRLYISGQNLLTVTNYTGFDPEASLNGQSLINKGIDQGVYPNSKSFQGGLTVTF